MNSATDEQTISVDFTNSELNYIIEALLYGSSVNISADWDKEDCKNLLSIAFKIKKQNKNLELNNICFFKETNYENEITEVLFNKFKKNLQVVELDNI